MRRKRPIAAAVMVAAAAAFAASATVMAKRILAFNREQLPARAHFMPVQSTSFTFGGAPVEFSEEAGAEGGRTVVVTFGEQALRLDETIPGGVEELPDLRKYEDWLRVFRFVEVRGMSAEQALEAVERDELDDRLVIIVRTPPPGVDAHSWISSWGENWVFDLHELTEAGDIISERLRYPSKRRGGEPPKPGELREGTWQYDAAMSTLPPVARPKPQFDNDASLFYGWTSGVLFVSGVAAALAAAFYFGPDRVKE